MPRTAFLALLFTIAALCGGMAALAVFNTAGPANPAERTDLDRLVTQTPSPHPLTHTAPSADKENPTVVYSRSGFDITPINSQHAEKLADTRGLTAEEKAIVLNKGTERAFCGNLLDNKKDGVYTCRLCRLPLFASNAKFDSGTGWPSFFQPFDKEHIAYHKDDSYGMSRVEILCIRCGGHLGHVFEDGPKPTGLRYCLNSASLEFIERKPDGSIPWQAAPEGQPTATPVKTQTAYFAGGCFWGVEDRFQQTEGVLDAVSGYMGGKADKPTYKQVCSGTTDHTETVRITFDPTRITYHELLEKFFKYHNPTQLNRQGPDVGTQYRSAIFADTPDQLAEASAFIEQQQKTPRFDGKKIVTQVVAVSSLDTPGLFHEAEAYHQDYHEHHGGHCAMPEE